jgi:hypothetical protein
MPTESLTVDPVVLDGLGKKLGLLARDLTTDERQLFHALLAVAGAELVATGAASLTPSSPDPEVEGFSGLGGVTVSGTVAISGTFGGPKGNSSSVSWDVKVTATAGTPAGLPKGWRP